MLIIIYVLYVSVYVYVILCLHSILHYIEIHRNTIYMYHCHVLFYSVIVQSSKV